MKIRIGLLGLCVVWITCDLGARRARKWMADFGVLKTDLLPMVISHNTNDEVFTRVLEILILLLKPIRYIDLFCAV